MDLSPPALTRSPSTPSHTYCASERSSLDYPSPELVEQQYKLSAIYGEPPCVISPAMEHETSLPPLDAMSQSEWGAAGVMHPSSSATSMPSILSSEYDAYGNYEPGMPGPYHHEIYHHSHTSHPHNTATPPPSSRSPAPSARSGLIYPSSASGAASLTPRIKMETSAEYAQSLEVSHYPSPRSIHAPYPAENGSYTSAGAGYLSDGGSSGWHKSDYAPTEPDHFYPGTSAPHTSSFVHDTRRQYRVTRPKRAPRRLTTKEEANFQCEIKGCGKLFSRSYNFKAHMETHDENREYPFPCPVNDCSKKFVRKTDLQRHHQSVHMKERNHKCDYCSRLFARKDTLRR